ncbi:hypothetical protein DFH08DRAFT_818257 [Mycena albidolilacea]|uniref:Peptidase A2 domain-containing protein n=1 Tax=Mycena albidolilacea TaxID=1033008 RepID=A0AAD6ZGG9_9AGAR|nr:hypothetical protein DFH08DRAFT_818257 [Mycena albidolilacea]
MRFGASRSRIVEGHILYHFFQFACHASQASKFAKNFANVTGPVANLRKKSQNHQKTAKNVKISLSHMEMIQLLLDRGANLECHGYYGRALGFAVHRRNLGVVKLLLDKGADATVTDVPLFILLDDWPPSPHSANLLYIAMGLRHPLSDGDRQRWLRQRSPAKRWEGLPLSQGKKELMALLMAHGASKDGAMDTISKHLTVLAKEAQHTEEEYLEVIAGMLKEAEDAVPTVLGD